MYCSKKIHILKIIGYFLIIFVILKMILSIVKIPYEPEDLLVYENPVVSDLIIVLEGEFYSRIDYALDLINSGYSRTIFYPTTNNERNIEYLKKQIIKKGIDVEVIYGDDIHSTMSEVKLSKKYLDDNINIENIIVITSPYHSYRAKWVFNKIIPNRNIRMVPVPQEKSWFSVENITKGTKDKMIFRREQIKCFMYFFLYNFI